MTNRGFDEIRYETRIEGSESPERIRDAGRRGGAPLLRAQHPQAGGRIRATILLNGATLMEIEHKPRIVLKFLTRPR